MKKEQLIKENAVLSQNNKELGEQNKKLKDDFCKILRLQNKVRGTYGDYENVEVSWAVIFAEVGKLKVVSDFRDFESKIEDLNFRIGGIESKLNEDKGVNI